MAAPIDIEIMVGRGDAQFSKEHVRHAGVEMLAGMDEHLAHPPGLGKRAAHRRDLDELRPCPDDSRDGFHTDAAPFFLSMTL